MDNDTITNPNNEESIKLFIECPPKKWHMITRKLSDKLSDIYKPLITNI